MKLLFLHKIRAKSGTKERDLNLHEIEHEIFFKGCLSCQLCTDLVLDRLVEHEQGLARALVQELVQQEGEPGTEHLLRHALGAPEQQLGVGLALHAALDEVGEQRLEDVGAVLHPALEGDHDEAGHVDPVPHGEVSVGLQSADEEEEECLVHDELSKQSQSFLLPHELRPVPLEHAVLLHPREQDLDAVGPVVQEGNAERLELLTHLSDLGLQLGEGLLALSGDPELEDVHLLLHILECPGAFSGLAAVGDQDDDYEDDDDEYAKRFGMTEFSLVRSVDTLVNAISSLFVVDGKATFDLDKKTDYLKLSFLSIV